MESLVRSGSTASACAISMCTSHSDIGGKRARHPLEQLCDRGQRGLVAHQHEVLRRVDRGDSPDLVRTWPPGCPASQRSPSAMPRRRRARTISTTSSLVASSRCRGVSVRITGRCPFGRRNSLPRPRRASPARHARRQEQADARRRLEQREVRELRTAEHHSDHARRERLAPPHDHPAEPRRLSPNPFAGRHAGTLRQAGAHGHAPPPSRPIRTSKSAVCHWDRGGRSSASRKTTASR